jgi:hypothetical protein
LFSATYVITLDNSVNGIRDLAGNPLKPNQLDQFTRFTINLGVPGTPGASNVDFGDAPDPSYPTTLANNGARHTLLPGFRLGAAIDAETNGLPTANADGDGTDDDGVVFVDPLIHGRTNRRITVTASEAGLLNAWIDFDRNGVWEPNEQIANNVALVAGANEIFVNVPPKTDPDPADPVSVVGATYARFRLNKAGNLGPSGAAADGEVEDYRVEIVQNEWQNPGTFANAHLDVSGDGIVSPLDSLLIINELNFGSLPTTLPTPRPEGIVPPFYDTSGDGNITALDALLVIQYLNNRSPSGEGESVSYASTASAPSAKSTPVAIAPPVARGSEAKEDEDDDAPITLAISKSPLAQLPFTFSGGNGVNFDLAGGFADEDDDDLLDMLAGDLDSRQDRHASDEFYNFLGA